MKSNRGKLTGVKGRFNPFIAGYWKLLLGLKQAAIAFVYF
jgi:hypothetical protein